MSIISRKGIGTSVDMMVPSLGRLICALNWNVLSASENLGKF